MWDTHVISACRRMNSSLRIGKLPIILFQISCISGLLIIMNSKLVNAQNTHSVADFIKQGIFLTNLERYITQILTLIKPWNG
jgi:hypothetical protein